MRMTAVQQTCSPWGLGSLLVQHKGRAVCCIMAQIFLLNTFLKLYLICHVLSPEAFLLCWSSNLVHRWHQPAGPQKKWNKTNCCGGMRWWRSLCNQAASRKMSPSWQTAVCLLRIERWLVRQPSKVLPLRGGLCDDNRTYRNCMGRTRVSVFFFLYSFQVWVFKTFLKKYLFGCTGS